jgi:hypothetical protein
VHKFCTTLMEKTVGEIGILNSDLFSDQFFLQCGNLEKNLCPSMGPNGGSLAMDSGLKKVR